MTRPDALDSVVTRARLEKRTPGWWIVASYASGKTVETSDAYQPEGYQQKRQAVAAVKKHFPRVKLS